VTEFFCLSKAVGGVTMALKNDRSWNPPSVNSPKRKDMPENAFLMPSQRKYPYKKLVNGKWVISCAGLRSAYILSGMRGATEVHKKALSIAKRVGCSWAKNINNND